MEVILLNSEELDIEDECAAGAPAAGIIPVSEVCRNPEAALFANLHELEAFGPSFDDAVEREARRAAALHRAIEEFAIGLPAGVVDGDGVARFWLSAFSSLEDFRFQAGFCFLGILGSRGDIFGCSWSFLGMGRKRCSKDRGAGSNQK